MLIFTSPRRINVGLLRYRVTAAALDDDDDDDDDDDAK